ncbi:AraC family transcriptional regulator [Nonomuraea sp. CA-143628]|uniref:helix-turn-helix transcriptional regulator n=1 Tax=Nonomuraea sp. CA-143628 TaxID=3239997 RepID=UPI003D90DFF3
MSDTAPWTGAVWLRPGALVYVGRLSDARAHAHAAVQLLVVSSGRVILTDERAAERSVSAVAIPAGVTHAMRAEDAFGASVYLDPALLEDGGESLVAGLLTIPVDEEFADTVLALLSAPRAAGPDRVVQQVMELVGRGIAGPLRLRDLAARVALSPSRLGHLFSEQSGLPFTAYVRWARLRAAMGTVRAGGSLTEAAHAAGFTDSAHLTRVTHAMFGLAPSVLARGMTWE